MSSLSYGLREFSERHNGKTLVLVAQDLSHWYVGEIAASANQAAMASGYRLMSLDFHRSAEREREILLAICDTQVNGCIFLWDYAPENLDLYAQIAEKCPCVQIGDHKPIKQLDHITADDYSGALAALDHLIHLGYWHIGHITLTSALDAVSDRRQAYFDAMHLARLPIHDEWLLELPYGLTDADRTRRKPLIRQFLSQPELPRALFICADWVASETVEVIQEIGISVPDSLALVGYDDAPPYALTNIPLTTVRHDLRQSAQLAVEQLLYRLNNGWKTAAPCEILIPSILVVRDSSVPLAPHTERWDFVLRYIQEHFRDELSVEIVANVLGLGPNYFSHQFTQIFGKRFTDYVHQIRLHYAAQLLLTTDQNIDNIAATAGFQSLNHFYALFKRTYHSSPNIYRKQHTFR